jgi:translation initiation factor IF-1
MSWVKEALTALQEKKSVTIQPFGGSMRGRIESGQLVTLEPVDAAKLQVNDVVFVEWGSNFLLHLVTGIKNGEIQIGNNLGKVNGWIPASAVLGRVIAVRDEEVIAGTVIEHCYGFTFRVKLDSGEMVEARATKHVALKLLTIRPGDRLRVGGLWNKKHRILGAVLSD